MRTKRPTNQVRMIAGQWRGRRLPVLDLPGLRPTGDRVRETAFNWLGPRVIGARCLDLFAGSGALGLEALSRGARSAVLVEQSDQAMRHIISVTENWPGIENAQFVKADAMQWLLGPAEPFDVIFVDPPFDAGLEMTALELIIQGGWLRPGGWLYLERAKGQGPLDEVLGEAWVLDRQKIMGQVEVSLLRYHSV